MKISNFQKDSGRNYSLNSELGPEPNPVIGSEPLTRSAALDADRAVGGSRPVWCSEHDGPLLSARLFSTPGAAHCMTE